MDSALNTTAAILGKQARFQSGKAVGNPVTIIPLGREHVPIEEEPSTVMEDKVAPRMDISSRLLKAFIIPRHMNVQYVEVA